LTGSNRLLADRSLVTRTAGNPGKADLEAPRAAITAALD
jgi:hypothetical protein